MSDTTTRLSPAATSGGDLMDESLVRQSDSVTQGKRPRVVIGGDTGYDGTNNDIVIPVRTDPGIVAGVSPAAFPALVMALVDETSNTYITTQLRPLSMTSDGRIRTTSVTAATYMDMFGDVSPIECLDKNFHYCPQNDPWGI